MKDFFNDLSISSRLETTNNIHFVTFLGKYINMFFLYDSKLYFLLLLWNKIIFANSNKVFCLLVCSIQHFNNIILVVHPFQSFPFCYFFLALVNYYLH